MAMQPISRESIFNLDWFVRYLQKKTRSRELKLFKHAFAQFLKNSGTIIDIPSGDGVLLSLFQEHRLTIYAVNSQLSPEDKKNWTQPGDKSVTFQQMDPKKLSFPDKAFDYVTSRGLLESYSPQEQLRFLKELDRVTRNILFIAVRTRHFSLTRLLCSWIAPDIWPASSLSFKELRALLAEQKNFQLLDIRPVGRLNKALVMAVLQKKP